MQFTVGISIDDAAGISIENIEEIIFNALYKYQCKYLDKEYQGSTQPETVMPYVILLEEDNVG